MKHVFFALIFLPALSLLNLLYPALVRADNCQPQERYLITKDQLNDQENNLNGHDPGQAKNNNILSEYFEANGRIYFLRVRTNDDASLRCDPDRTPSYKAEVIVGLYRNKKLAVEKKLGDFYSGSYNGIGFSPLIRGTLSLVNQKIMVFFTEKSPSESHYGQNGYIFTLNPDNLEILDQKELFKDKNWGWYAKIDNNGDINHFSYAGYLKMKNSRTVRKVRPESEALNHLNQKINSSGRKGNLTAGQNLPEFAELLWSYLNEDLK
jgi:hypothetical protein